VITLAGGPSDAAERPGPFVDHRVGGVDDPETVVDPDDPTDHRTGIVGDADGDRRVPDHRDPQGDGFPPVRLRNRHRQPTGA